MNKTSSKKKEKVLKKKIPQLLEQKNTMTLLKNSIESFHS